MLLDTASLYFRAFFGVPDTMKAADGTPTNAIRGLLDFIARLVENHRPTHLVACWDDNWRPSWRVALIPSYKAQRVEFVTPKGEQVEDVPDRLEVQVPYIRACLEALGIAVVGAPDHEADDVIGTLSHQATMPVDVVTGDRDLIQLVRDPVVTLLFTLRGVSELAIYDEEGVLDKFGVPASRYVEYAILRGDPSDGLPGVKGVGEKTARELVTTYPSLEAMLAAAAGGDRTIKPALRTKLLESADYIASMQRLVPIQTAAPLSLWAGERDDEGLLADAPELGLKGPTQRLLAALSSANAV